MIQYRNLCERILREGVVKSDRTGTGTKSIFGHQMRFDLNEGFPLLTLKKTPFKSVIAELIWFLEGSTDNNRLRELGATIWDEWAKDNGDLGPIYGKQWRSWDTGRMTGPQHDPDRETIDQIAWVINEIRRNPDSRRLVVSAWNVGDLDRMALSPCHCLFQFYVSDGKLSCHLYQRSADVFLGVPFNIASYAAFTHMVASVCGLAVGDFIHSFGDAHLYLNHLEQTELMLSREDKFLPQLIMNKGHDNIDYFTVADFALQGYDPHPAIKVDVAV